MSLRTPTHDRRKYSGLSAPRSLLCTLHCVQCWGSFVTPTYVLTSKGRGNKPVKIPALHVALEPLKFMEFALEGATQACIFGRTGACMVNLPAPERYAVHKLVVYGERPVAQRTKATKDLLQVAALASYFVQTGQAAVFNTAWRDLVSRGRGWHSRAKQGRTALLKIAPEVAITALWKE